MFSPGKRALSCSDLCLREPKYPSHSIMWSGCLSLSETERRARGGGGLATSEGGQQRAGAGNNGGGGFVTRNLCPSHLSSSDPPRPPPTKLDQTMELWESPNLSGFERAFAFLLEVLFPDGRQLLEGGLHVG